MASAASPRPETVALQQLLITCPICAHSEHEAVPHALLSQRSTSDHFEEAMVTSFLVDQQVQCLRCNSVRKRYLRGDSDQYWASMSNGEERCEYYFTVHEFTPAGLCPIGDKKPALLSSNDHKSKDTEGADLDQPQLGLTEAQRACLPPSIARLLLEVEAASASSSWLLWTMGLRMLLEEVTEHFEIEKRFANGKRLDLKGRILFLHRALSPHLSQHQNKLELVCSSMQTIRLFGNDAAHQREAPPRGQLAHISSLIKTLLDIMFFLPAEYEALQSSVSARVQEHAVSSAKVVHPKN